MVPISHYYLDREPPNASSVKEAIRRRSMAAGTSVDANGSAPQLAADGAMPVPTNSTSASSLPPTPAAKDVPMPQIMEESNSQQGTNIEPAPHPQVDDVEGPVTTTIALPADDDDEGPTGITEPYGSLPTQSEDNLEEISLGGGSQRDDGEEEEIDLS
jgi:hypothetical protein